MKNRKRLFAFRPQGLVAGMALGFSTEVEFTNSCCIEMRLDVFHPGEGGLALTVPLTHPEG